MAVKRGRGNASSRSGSGSGPMAPTAPLTKSGCSSRRHRERHRCIVSSLESDVTDKLSKLQLLVAENDMLKLRGAVLEAAVLSREDQ
eukprot:gene172-361_t